MLSSATSDIHKGGVNDDLTAFDLTSEELMNIDKTVETLRAQVLMIARQGGKTDETLIHRMKKAYKIQQEQDFNRQFPK